MISDEQSCKKLKNILFKIEGDLIKAKKLYKIIPNYVNQDEVVYLKKIVKNLKRRVDAYEMTQ